MGYLFIRLKSKKEWTTCLKTMWNMRMIGSKKISFWETESEAVMKILSVTGSPYEYNILTFLSSGTMNVSERTSKRTV